MSLVEFVIDKLDDLKGTEIVHFERQIIDY